MTERRWGLLALGIALVGWILGGEWASIHAHDPENHFIDALTGLSFLLSGLVALDQRPRSRIGVLMIAYVVVNYLGNWGELHVPAVPAIGASIGQQLGAPIVAHIALSYPAGRLHTRFERAVIGVIYGVKSLASVVILLTFDPRHDGCRCAWEPAPFPSKAAVLTTSLAAQRADFVLGLLFLVAVWLRWRRATPGGRRELAPLWIAVCVICLVDLAGAFSSPDPVAQPFAYLVWELQNVLVVTVPIIFVWGLLSTQLARSAVGDLVIDLDKGALPGELRACLTRALGDPSLEMLYTRDGQAGWVDADGQPRPVPDPANGQQARDVTMVERDGQLLAALIHDPALDQQLVRAAAAAAGMAIANERLQAEVMAQLEEVRASRQRIVEAVTPNGAGSSGTSTTGPSSGWSRSPCRWPCSATAPAATRRWRHPLTRPTPNSGTRSPSCANWHAASTRRSSPKRDCPPPWKHSPTGQPCRFSWAPTSPGDCRGRSRPPPTSWWPNRLRTSPDTPAPPAPWLNCRYATGRCAWR